MAKKDIVISVKHVSKNFVLPHERVDTIKSTFVQMFGSSNREVEVQHALKDISFEIERGEFFGIVGRNGSGKSTLLKILAGIYQPSSGNLRTSGKLVPFIELGVGFNGELTGRENVYLNGALLGFSKKRIDEMYDDIVEFAELGQFMDQRLKNYSSGMQVRLAFSLATRAQADILLVDEVLAVGDADFQRKCFDYFRKLKKSHTTVVFVSHDMNAVREYCDRAILIEENVLKSAGTADEIAMEYAKLFNRQSKAVSGDGATRWGDNQVKYDDVSVEVGDKTAEGTITIRATATAQERIDDPIFGFAIRNSAGLHMLGTNSKIKRHDIGILEKGQRIEMEWSVANILNDGTYTLDPAIVHSDGITVCDWWEGATSFAVFKEDRTPYSVSPFVTITTKKNK